VRDPSVPSTGWWWGTWIAANVIGLASYFTTDDPTRGGEAVYHYILAAVTTVAIVFWIRVVQTVLQAQDALAGVTIAPSAREEQIREK
jgi:heme exporter protein D